MRLWSLHPKYLDSIGLIALWREALLAQAVLAGRTVGYTRHPQLRRFLQSPAPIAYMSGYLRAVHAESARRNYRFDAGKILGAPELVEPQLAVPSGQLGYEWQHLRDKLSGRSPQWFARLAAIAHPDPHPLFHVVDGGIAEWEVAPRRHGRNSHQPDR
jgi:hypothetical protein